MKVESTEWTFAADAAKWMSSCLRERSGLPFADAKVEQRGAGSARRNDLVLYDRDGKPALSGEIKLPDTAEGQSPFHAKLVNDARRKAARLGCPFFFTWNVNRLVLWQSGQEHEIRVMDAVQIRSRVELGFPSVERQLREDFIPGFLETFARISEGKRPSVCGHWTSGLSAGSNRASTACRTASSPKCSNVIRRNPPSRRT